MSDVQAGHVIGSADDVQKYASRILEEVRGTLRATSLYGRRSCFTEALMAARSYLTAVERFSRRVRVQCILSAPRWSVGESITAHVQCTFSFMGGGVPGLFHRHVILSVDDGIIWFRFLNNGRTYPLPMNDVPRLYPGLGSSDWNEGDLRNTLAEIALWDALGQIPRSAWMYDEVAQRA